LPGLISDTETETMLQKQIDSVLAGIGNEEIRKIMNDNNMLREEIIKLQK